MGDGSDSMGWKYMKKDLIVVGNKPPTMITLSNSIDSFDYVFRLGRMNYYGYTGVRIDGIFLEANVDFKHVHEGGEHRGCLKIPPKVFMKQYWYERFSDWQKYLTVSQYNNIEVVNISRAESEIGFQRLTSSVLFIHYLLNSDWFNHYNIHVTCLDIEERERLIDHNPLFSWHKGGGFFEQQYLEKMIKKQHLHVFENR